jgi:hypothetical protein
MQSALLLNHLIIYAFYFAIPKLFHQSITSNSEETLKVTVLSVLQNDNSSQ